MDPKRSRLVRRQATAVAAAAAVVALSWLTACSSPAADVGATSAPTSLCPSGPAALKALGSRISDSITKEFKLSYTDEYRNVRAVLVSVCGTMALERYEKSSASDTHDIFSVTKSFVSTLVGLALADGSLRSLDQPLAQLLPDHLTNMTPQVAAITLRQLLTMTAGLDEDLADGTTGPWMESKNFVRGILRQGVHQPPGSQFGYSSASSHLLAAILVRATGRPLLDYARDKLLDPLGIDTRPAAQPLTIVASQAAYDKASFAWPVDHQGINFGGGGLKITPRDMVKLGQLYLDGGRWKGKQILPAAWVHEATTGRVSAPGSSNLGYGYQWWVTEAGGDPAYAAVGFGGQLIEVVPSRQLVVVFSTELHTAADPVAIGTDQLQDIVSRIITPAVTP